MAARRTIDDFFDALTDDGAKADVLKAQIAADSATEQVRLKEANQTERTKAQDSTFSTGLFTVRGFYAGFALAAVVAYCVAWYNVALIHRDVDLARIQHNCQEAR